MTAATDVMRIVAPVNGATVTGPFTLTASFFTPARDGEAENTYLFCDGRLVAERQFKYPDAVQVSSADFVKPRGFVLQPDGTWWYDCTLDPSEFGIPDGLHTFTMLFIRFDSSVSGSLTWQVTTANPTGVMKARSAIGVPRLGVGQSKGVPAQTLALNMQPVPVPVPTPAPAAAPTITYVADPGTCVRYGPNGRQITAQSSAVPHFGNDGRVHHFYVPGVSAIVRTVFGLDESTYNDTAATPAAVQSAGINALRTGFWFFPQFTATDENDYFTNHWLPFYQAKRKAAGGMPFVVIADDITGSAQEQSWLLTVPWAPAALKLTLQRIVQDGGVFCNFYLDEANTKISDPTVPGSIAQVIRQVWESVPGAIASCWPGQEAIYPNGSANFETPQLSEFAGRFMSHTLEAYPLYQATQQWSTDQIRRQMQKHFRGLDVFPCPDPDRPLAINMSLGMVYFKNSPGNTYNPAGGDIIQSGAGITKPEQIGMQGMVGVGWGATVLLPYGWDSAYLALVRQNTPVGSPNELQLGVSPTVNVPQWQALSALYNTIAAYESRLLQPHAPAFDWGPEWETYARSGTGGSIAVAVNCTDATRNPGPSPPGTWTKQEMFVGATRTARTGGPVPSCGAVIWSA